MSLLTQASLVLTPTSYKANKLYSIVPSNGNGDTTVTRATTATRTNSSGLVETVALNVPRLDYTNGVGSILLEPQRTNLLTYSDDFSNAVWNGLGTRTINAGISPNGSNNACKLDNLILDSTYRVINISGINTYTFSCWVKGEGSEIGKLFRLEIRRDTGTFINSFTNVVLTSSWQRISVTLTTLSDTVGLRLIFNTQTNYATSVLVWGAQLEQGAYATSYIPTTTSIVTRNQDIMTLNNIYTNNFITSAGGTWFIELNNNFALTRDIFSYSIYINTNSNSTGNGFNIVSSSSGRFSIQKTTAGIFSGLYTTLTDIVKIVIKWNGTTADVYVNGIKVVSATAFTTTAMEYLYVIAQDTPKYIKSMMLFPTSLTDAECASITTL